MTARSIKKYANRRLYDCQQSRYITTVDIQSILEKGEAVNITEARTGKDITRSVLLNLLAEAELHGKSPILSQQMLAQLLCYDNELLSGFLGNYLEQCLSVFIRHQTALLNNLHDFDSLTSPYELIAQSIHAQEKIFANFPQQQDKEIS